MSAVERVRAAYARIEQVDRPEVWITLRPQDDVLAEAAAVDARVAAGEELPLAGLVFAVKDNIDVAGLPTTAACPSFTYEPSETAPVVARTVGAGALVLGKTNMDQFATGLVGTRSPYGAVRDATRPELVSGGSSSGSAVAVALGIADFSFGTDTAGSGRVPAAFQGLVGYKGTRGLVPTVGVVPACRTLDCVTVFAPTLSLAEQVMDLVVGPHPDDPTSRAWPPAAPLAAPPAPRVAVPPSEQLSAMSPEWIAAFERTVEQLRGAGATIVPVDLEPFLAAASLLYGGAFIAERYAAVGEFLAGAPDADPTVSALIVPTAAIPAHALVDDTEKLDRIKLHAAGVFAEADALLVPTVPEHPSIATLAADPIGANTRVGAYTNFVNLLDLAGVAVPAGGIPSFGVTVVVPAFADRVAADIARLLLDEPAAPELAQPSGVPVFVVGAHLSGQPLNGQLTAHGARLVGPRRSAPVYRMFALDSQPPKPGLVRVDDGGGSVEGELWSLPPTGLAALLAGLPAPMALGPVRLEDGSTPVGFLVEPAATAGARDITELGGWRAYLAERAAAVPA